MKNRNYYWLLISKDQHEINANMKWERDLLPEIILAKHHFSRVKNICRDNKLREFYFKLLHRIVVTKRELFTYGIAEKALCPYWRQNDSIIHKFCNCHWTKWFFSEVIKWFNVENATSFAPSSSELIFGLNNDRKNQSSSAIVKKLDFTILFAKYYLYINKLAPKDLSLDEFKAKISWRCNFEKPPSSTS